MNRVWDELGLHVAVDLDLDSDLVDVFGVAHGSGSPNETWMQPGTWLNWAGSSKMAATEMSWGSMRWERDPKTRSALERVRMKRCWASTAGEAC